MAALSLDREVRLPLPSNPDPDRNGEPHYYEIAFPNAKAESDGVSYVRFLREGVEVLYYDVEEWREQPREVMGAIMALLLDDVRKSCDCDGCVAGIRRHVFTGCPGLPNAEIIERCGECDLLESDEAACKRVAPEHGLVAQRVECDEGHEHWMALRPRKAAV